MNLQAIVNMILRQLLNRGISKGIAMAARRGRGKPGAPPGDAQRAKAGGDMAKRALRAMRLGRRL